MSAMQVTHRNTGTSNNSYSEKTRQLLLPRMAIEYQLYEWVKARFYRQLKVMGLSHGNGPKEMRYLWCDLCRGAACKRRAHGPLQVIFLFRMAAQSFCSTKLNNCKQFNNAWNEMPAHLIPLMMFILYHKMHGLCFTIKLSFITIAIVDRIWVEQDYPHLACLAFIEFQRKLKYTISSSKTLPQPTTDILVCIYQLLIVFPILLSFCWQHCCCHLG